MKWLLVNMYLHYAGQKHSRNNLFYLFPVTKVANLEKVILQK